MDLSEDHIQDLDFVHDLDPLVGPESDLDLDHDLGDFSEPDPEFDTNSKRPGLDIDDPFGLVEDLDRDIIPGRDSFALSNAVMNTYLSLI